MVTGIKTSVMILILGVGFNSNALDEVTFVCDQYPPIIVLDAQNKPSGPGVDVLNKITSYVGIQSHIVIEPWVRAAMTVKESDHTCVVGLHKSKKVINDYWWIGPVTRQQWVIIQRASDQRQISKFSDMSLLKIGVERGSKIISILEDNHLKSVDAVNDGNNLKMLLMNRIDVWATTELIAKPRIDTLEKDKPKIAWRFGEDDGYLACNKKMEERILKKLQQGVQYVRDQGDLIPFGLKK